MIFLVVPPPSQKTDNDRDKFELRPTPRADAQQAAGRQTGSRQTTLPPFHPSTPGGAANGWYRYHDIYFNGIPIVIMLHANFFNRDDSFVRVIITF